MNKPQLKEHHFNIVLVGDFNPQIFQPEWFIAQKLFGETEGRSAKIEVVHPDVTVFSLDWLRFEVTRNRLVATTRDQSCHESLRDLIVGTFTILSHTPLKMMGINNTFFYIINNEDVWHNIGNVLAPKDIWGKVMSSPGLTSLTIQSKDVIEESFQNTVKITIGPAGVKLGFQIHINDHYQLTKIETPLLGSRAVIEILQREWDVAQKKVRKIETDFFEALP